MATPAPAGTIPPWATHILLSALALFVAIMVALLSWQLLTVTQLKSDVAILQAGSHSMESRVKKIETSGIDKRFRKPEATEAHATIAREADSAHKAIYASIKALRDYFDAIIDRIFEKFKRNENLIENALQRTASHVRTYTFEEAQRDIKRTEAMISALSVRVERYKQNMLIIEKELVRLQRSVNESNESSPARP